MYRRICFLSILFCALFAFGVGAAYAEDVVMDLPTSGNWVRGAFVEGDEVFIYKLIVKSPSRVTIDARQYGIHFYYVLCTPEDESIDHQVIVGEGSPSKPFEYSMTEYLNPGTYHVVMRNSGRNLGQFDLRASVKKLSITEQEPNGERARALTLAFDKNIKGMLAAPYDTDYYKFTVSKTGGVRLNFTVDIDKYFKYTVYTASFKKVAEGEGPLPYSGTPKYSRMLNLKAGVHYIKIEGNNSTLYTMSLKTGTAVKSIKVKPTSVFLVVGQHAKLSYTATPAKHDEKITWIVEDDWIAYISSKGEIDTHQPGTTYAVAVSESGALGKCKVTIVYPPPQKVIIPKKATFTADMTYQIPYELSPSMSDDTGMVWKSSKTSVVSVGKYGEAHALKAGKAAITLKARNGKSAKCDVTVLENVFQNPKPLYGKQKAVYTSTKRMAYKTKNGKKYLSVEIFIYNRSGRVVLGADLAEIEIHDVFEDGSSYALKWHSVGPWKAKNGGLKNNSYEVYTADLLLAEADIMINRELRYGRYQAIFVPRFPGYRVKSVGSRDGSFLPAFQSTRKPEKPFS